MNIVSPATTSRDENLSSPRWKPLVGVGATADSASSPPAPTPRPHTGTSPPFGVDPPRPPRDGYDEQEARDISFASPMSSMSADKQLHPQHSSSPYLSESAHVLSLQRPPQAPASRRGSRAPRLTPVSTVSQPSQPRVADTTLEVNIETEHPPSEKHDSSTWHRLLHHVEAKLHLRKHKSRNWNDEEISEHVLGSLTEDHGQHERAVPGLGKTGTWLREEFGNSRRTKKIFGRAPWNRKDSTATFSSVSSSLREVLRGDTPPASPSMAYNAAYFNHKWITNTFPGGEAVRVSTPPMDEDTADGRPRGFFSSLTPPEPETASTGSYMTPMNISYASPKYNAHRMSIAVPSREWWESKPQRQVKQGDADNAVKFEFDVPEHLPSSPMCPANVRHKSGGKGLCVYHGRRRAVSTVHDEGSKRQGSASMS
ncbi:hypothetical protein PWT90_00950 [Aphanocladium album]|nr:hypothetical protein PWT90_00950 [Aphanocladium album]